MPSKLENTRPSAAARRSSPQFAIVALRNWSDVLKDRIDRLHEAVEAGESQLARRIACEIAGNAPTSLSDLVADLVVSTTLKPGVTGPAPALRIQCVNCDSRDVADEYDRDDEGEVTNAWWKCLACGHEWRFQNDDLNPEA